MIPPAARRGASAPTTKTSTYQRFRAQQARISRERSAAGREIGPIPPVADPARKEACRLNLRLFLGTYLADRFFWPWSADHLAVIGLLQVTILEGGQYAVAMPRGFGKTTICEAGSLWAALYGHRRFIVPIGATSGHGEVILESLKIELETNELLLADFPEVCFPVVSLEGIANRCKGQTVGGERTRMLWTNSEIILPTVIGSPASGAVVRCFGLTGALRGTKHTTPDGQIIRPDLVLLDDPQTDESAKSPMQNAERIRIISGAVLGLAGRKRKIAALMPTTVISPGDMADQLLDRNKHPEWHGQRCKMLYALPANKDLWNQYAEIRRESMRAGNRGREATEFYAANRAAMDAGAAAAWPECFYDDELSAIQHAMNFLIDNERAFWAEAQNEPKAEELVADVRQLEEKDLAAKLNQLPRGIVPRDCAHVTAFVDVQAECLFWAVCGWTEKFGGALVDFGVYPPQSVAVFEAATAPRRLSIEPAFANRDQKGRIYSALAALVPQLMGMAWKQDGADGALTCSLCLIDCGFETDAVHDFIARSPLRAVLRPSKGRGIGPSSKPLNEYRKDPGDLTGWNWRIDAKTMGKGRFVQFDANRWKSFVAEALLAPPGATGSFYLPGAGLPEHPLLTLHLLSEYRVPTFGPHGRCEEWKSRPDRRENHWFDCVVGCAVAASVTGVKFSAAVSAGEPAPRDERRPRIPASEMIRRRREEKARQG